MGFNNRFQQRMAIEALEDKRLLAGDVTVSLVEGSLLIQGDAASNGVAVSTGDAPDTYIVSGLVAGDGDTSINGMFDRVEVSGVTEGIAMRLAEGDDIANLVRANVRGSVAIAAGMGNDHVNIGGPMFSVADMNTHIRGHVAVDLNEGNDSLRVGNALIGRGLAANGGPGDDDMAIVGSRLRGVVGLHTGEGADHVSITETQARFVRLGTGAGADEVALVDSAFAVIDVNMGEDHDALLVSDVHARGARFQGGPGHDALQFQGPSHIGRLVISGFETVGGSSDVQSMFARSSGTDVAGSVDHPMG